MLTLFTTFFKIGLFTFGGGYGMISIVHDECIEKRNWVTEKEFVDMLSIAESTPGPIAINMATYVGYKKEKFVGAIIATLGVVLPSLIIIYIISMFFKDALNIKIISDAFFGIRVAVTFVIIRTAYNLIKNEIKNSDMKILTIIFFLLYTVIFFFSELFDKNISVPFMIVLAICIGIVFDVVFIIKEKLIEK